VKKQSLSLPTHLSLVWGVTLAVLTIIEWRSLDRDPIGQQVFLPFIEREISVLPATISGNAPEASRDAASMLDGPVRYEVEFHFNGPLFLACFFVPVMVFHGGAWLLARAHES
jgi:hypothetical protein